MSLSTSLVSILPQYSISEVEFTALLCPGYEIAMPPKKLASATVVEAWNPNTKNFTANEILEAIDGLINKGWLKIATCEDLIEHHKIIDQLNIPFQNDIHYRQEDVIFTEYGFFKYQEILSRVYPYSFNNCIRVLDKKNKNLVLYGETLEDIERWFFRDEFCISTYIGKDAIVKSISPGVPAGPYYFNRYKVIPKGFKKIVTYELYTPEKFVWNEFDCSFTLFEDPGCYISGQLNNYNFSLSESISYDELNGSKIYNWHFNVSEIESEIFTPGIAKIDGKAATGYVIPQIIFEANENLYERRNRLKKKDMLKILKQQIRNYLNT